MQRRDRFPLAPALLLLAMPDGPFGLPPFGVEILPVHVTAPDALQKVGEHRVVPGLIVVFAQLGHDLFTRDAAVHLVHEFCQLAVRNFAQVS